MVGYIHGEVGAHNGQTDNTDVAFFVHNFYRIEIYIDSMTYMERLYLSPVKDFPLILVNTTEKPILLQGSFS